MGMFANFVSLPIQPGSNPDADHLSGAHGVPVPENVQRHTYSSVFGHENKCEE